MYVCTYCLCMYACIDVCYYIYISRYVRTSVCLYVSFACVSDGCVCGFRCRWIVGPDGMVVPFPPSGQDKMIEEIVGPWSSAGLRTLCVAYREFVQRMPGSVAKTYIHIYTYINIYKHIYRLNLLPCEHFPSCVGVSVFLLISLCAFVSPSVLTSFIVIFL